MIRIQAKIDGFRRLGVAHPAAPTEYLDDKFTKEQVTALSEEPNLLVWRVSKDGKTEFLSVHESAVDSGVVGADEIPEEFARAFEALREDHGRISQAHDTLVDELGTVSGKVVELTEQLETVTAERDQWKSAHDVVAEQLKAIAPLADEKQAAEKDPGKKK